MGEIRNPNLAVALEQEAEAALADAMEDGDFLRKRGRIKIRNFTKYDDPERFDRQFRQVLREIDTKVVDLDAVLIESDGSRVRYNAETYLQSPTVQRRLAEAKRIGRLTKDEEQLTRATLDARYQARALKEGDDFEYGYYPDERPLTGRVFPIQDVVLPSLTSPQAKQALLMDVLDAARKSWEAYTFNPIARRIPKLISQFVLGRGVKGAIDKREHQQAWDDFWKRNKMRPRCKQSLRELVIYGEIFWRFFRTNEGLVVRSIDPTTIWDIVTDEDDIEAVQYYHQQYVQINASPIPGRQAIPSKLVIRQIPAAEVDHYKINSTSAEKRGRGDLFPVLGYLLRFKEYVNDRIALNKLRAMFAIDVAVEGDASDVARADEQFSTPPGPAALLVHNKAIEVEFKNASTNAGDAITDAETILKVIAIGAGVSEQFLGVSRASTRAGALISTEPDVKNFEDYQELVEEILLRTSERVFEAANLTADVIEFTFPAIAQEDRSAKIKDIAFSESMDYFTKERAATMAAREFQISDYHFEEEQRKIAQERGRTPEPVMATGLQQVPKVAPAEPGGEQPGLGGDLKPAKPGVTQTSAQMGLSAKNLSGRTLSNTRATLNRPAFTRGGERLAIQNQRTSGTPLRHAAEGPKPGWGAAARLKSLEVRRARAEARRRQLKGDGS